MKAFKEFVPYLFSIENIIELNFTSVIINC